MDRATIFDSRSRPIRGEDLDKLEVLKRNAEYVRAAPVLGVYTVEMQKSVIEGWAELKEKYGLPEDLALEDYPLPPSDSGLAHILWRTAKQLVSLLEKEYGFGQKQAPYIGNDVGKDISGEPWTVPPGHRAGIGQREVSKKRQSTPHALIGREEGPVCIGQKHDLSEEEKELVFKAGNVLHFGEGVLITGPGDFE